MTWTTALRAGVLQGALIFVVALVLGAVFERDFFVSWGWLAGPGAWVACALLVGAVSRLPWPGVLAGAALSGLPSLIAVLSGVHWAGIPLAVLAFGVWCGWLAHRFRDRPSRAGVPPGGIEPPLPA